MLLKFGKFPISCNMIACICEFVLNVLQSIQSWEEERETWF